MTASWKNKLVGAVATGAIVAGLFPAAALGVGASVLDSTADDASTADVVEGPGYKLEVSGLEDGDTAKYYQIITQDFDDTTVTPTKVGTQQWKLHSNVDSDGDGIVDGTENTSFGHKDDSGAAVNGLWIDELVISDYEDNPTKVTSDTRQLTPAMVNALATAVTNNKPAALDTLTASDGKVTVDNAASGMYMFVATPASGDTNYLYKPIFVSADYYNSVSTPEDNTHAIEIEEGVTDYPETSGESTNAGVFKRSPLEIDKYAGQYDDKGNVEDLQSDVAVGDTIDFYITVPIPTFTENYVAPMFYITDTLTEGLKLDASSIEVSVKNGDEPVTVAEDTDYKIYVKDAATSGTDYFDFKNTVAEDSTFDAFVVQFLNDAPGNGKKDGFLYTVLGAPTATIHYQATVTSTDAQKFAQQINQMDNTAKLNYSQDPNYIPDGYFGDDGKPDNNFDTDNPDTTDENGDEEDTGELTDKTRHYTFDLDADVLGRDQSGDTKPGGEDSDDNSWHDKTSEIRKIWVDANGSVIQERESSKVKYGGTEQEGSKGEYGWLEGAEFTLTKVQESVVTGVGEATLRNCDEAVIEFDDNHIKAASGSNPISDSRGYIEMRGLDAGKYILKEVKAPLGYTFNPAMQYEITITPTYVLEPPTPDEGTTPEDGKGGADDLILESYTVVIKAQKLNDKMNIVEEEYVTTTSTYTLEKDDANFPKSTLDEDGTLDETVTITTASIASNKTAMIVNKKLGLLPATGGSGIIFYLGVGGAVAMLASYLLSKTKEEDPLA